MSRLLILFRLIAAIVGTLAWVVVALIGGGEPAEFR